MQSEYCTHAIILNRFKIIVMLEFTHRNNFIKIAAHKSFIGAKCIMDAILLNLKAGNTDPDIMLMYNSYNPYCLAFDNCYGIWSSIRRSNPGNTLGIVQLLEQLSHNKIKSWDIAIQVIYENTTVEYKKLLPNHRYPFNSGKVSARILALTDLITAMGTDASLATVKTQVTSFALLLKNATILQQDQLNDIDTAITAMEAASNDASDEAFRIFGCLIIKYYKTPKLIDAFFPVAMLQNVSQSTFTTMLKTKKPKKVFKRKLDIVKNSLRFTNTGTETAHAYFTNGLTDLPSADTLVFVIQPNTIIDCNPAFAGYTDDKRHLHIVNTGSTGINIEVDIMAV